MLNLIYPRWDAPDNIKAFSTTRTGGGSQSPYTSLNLGDHVGDNPSTVQANRELLPLPGQPYWLQQVHGTKVVEYRSEDEQAIADGCYSQNKNQVCVVMTADCLPLLLTDKKGSFVAALHCGWRGLANGIIQQFLAARDNLEDIIAWLGPAIGPDAFEVGDDVFSAFAGYPRAFCTKSDGKYLADLALITRSILQDVGVINISVSDLCTYSQKESFFSYRRDGVTGRMASCIWID